MLGVNLLVRLGRKVLAGPVAEAGLLPASYYRHLTLSALEAEDFAAALNYLKFAQDQLLDQILVLRLRLLAGRHARQRQAILDLMEAPGNSPEKYQELIEAEDRAIRLLKEYEGRALALMNRLPGPTS